MPANLLLDHVILTVDQLPSAIRQFTQMGFLVTPGGVHAGGFTQNALVSFADGSYLELLTNTRRSGQIWVTWLRRFGLLRLATSGDAPLGRRLKEDLARGPGVQDFCLRSVDLTTELPELQGRGIQAEGLSPGSRIRPDGEEISWFCAFPQSTQLPFLIEDVTPREMRVPPAPEQGHANQVIGIAGLSIGVTDLENSRSQYRALLDMEPSSSLSFPLTGVQGVEFSLDGVRINLIRPEKDNLRLRKAMGRRPLTPLAVWLRTPAAEPSGLLSLSYPASRRVTLSRGNPFL